MSRLKTISTAFATAALLLLTLAPAALAENNDGRGFYGETNDKVVTNAGFLVIIFFALFVFVMSMIQRRLEKRKEASKAAKKQLRGIELHGGW
jgi:Na+/melibiose symporter-like transporter